MEICYQGRLSPLTPPPTRTPHPSHPSPLTLHLSPLQITWDDIEDNLGLIDRRQRMGPFERVYEVLDNPGTSKMGTLAGMYSRAPVCTRM